MDVRQSAYSLQSMTVAETLKEWRSKAQLSQCEAAEELGVSLRSFQEWEQGRREPSGATFAALWTAFSSQFSEIGSATGKFSDLLRTFRKDRKFNRQKAAEILGVTAGAIKDWEQERRTPNAASVCQILPHLIAHGPWQIEEKQRQAKREEDADRIARSMGFRPGKPREELTLEQRLRRAQKRLARLQEELGRCDKHTWFMKVRKLKDEIYYAEGWVAKYERKILERETKEHCDRLRIEQRAPRRKSPVIPATTGETASV